MNYQLFSNFPDAFDYCREVNQPVRVVIIGNMAWKLYELFPSGRADFIRAVDREETKELMTKRHQELGIIT